MAYNVTSAVSAVSLLEGVSSWREGQMQKPVAEAPQPPAADQAASSYSSAAEPDRKKQKTKAKKLTKKHLCHEFERTGACQYGDSCGFAHGQAQLKQSFRKPEPSAARLLLRQRAAARHASGPPTAAAVDWRPVPPGLIERDYTQTFWVSPSEPAACPMYQNQMVQQQAGGSNVVPEAERKSCTDEDQYVNMHKNELCVVGAAGTHSMFAAGRTVVGVSFRVDTAGMSGKKKKGALKLVPFLSHRRR